MRPFEGIRIIDVTHVLAGPFAAYQLAVLGADVIKVEHPADPDQSRVVLQVNVVGGSVAVPRHQAERPGPEEPVARTWAMTSR